MTRQMPFGMQVWNIKRFLVKNGYDPSQIDVEAYIDPTLSLTENRKLFAQQLGIRISQMGGRDTSVYTKHTAKEIDERYCQYLQENCEQKCNNNACRSYNKMGCPATMGVVQPCDQRSKRSQQRTTASNRACTVREYCVQAHTRPPQHNSRTGQPIPVDAYCVTIHNRACRRSGW